MSGKYPNKNMELQLITMLCFHKLFAWSFFCKQAHRTLVKKTPLVLFSPYIDSWSYECLKGKVLCGKLLAQFSILHSDSIGRNWMLRVCVDLMKKLLLISAITFSLSKAVKSCQHLSWQAEFCLLENDRKRKKTASWNWVTIDYTKQKQNGTHKTIVPLLLTYSLIGLFSSFLTVINAMFSSAIFWDIHFIYSRKTTNWQGFFFKN